MPRTLELIGHRGARGLVAENTLASFARTLTIGVHALELDVHISRDGVVVVHHDDRLNPRQQTHAAQQLPSLEQVIDLIQATGNRQVRLIIEMKLDARTPHPDMPAQTFCDAVVEVLERRDMLWACGWWSGP